MSENLGVALATTLARARRERGLTGEALAVRAGVSRAMIGKIERGEAQPTAVLLGRLSAALGLTLSQLVAQAENVDADHGRLAQRAAQPIWTDPGTGYVRRAVSPPAGGPLELVEVELPAGVEVSFAADTYAFIHQQLWVLSGTLVFREGGTEHVLRRGDCLQLGAPADCTFVNRGRSSCRYLVALIRRDLPPSPRTA